MGYIFGSLASLLFGLLFVIWGVTGKVPNGGLPLQEDVKRGLCILCGFMGIVLSVVILLEGHKN